MRSRFRPNHGTVVAYLALFVALGGTTYAATGGNFILGQSNSAGNTTSLSAPLAGKKALQLTNTSTGAGATALGLNVASGHPPFTVNSGTKVANLNADKLDGLDSTTFTSTRTLVWNAAASTTPPTTTIATVGPYTIKGNCLDDGSGGVFVKPFVSGPAGTDDYMFDTTSNDTTFIATRSNGLLIPANTNTLIVSTPLGSSSGNYGRFAGTAMLKTNTGTLVEVDFNAVADARSSGSCFIYGTATKGT
jgi:hypothetical protein